MTAKPFLIRVFSRLKKTAVLRWFYEKQALIILKLDPDSYRPSATFEAVKINSRDAIENFSESESWHDKDEIIHSFNQRLKRGEVLASLEVDNLLACYAWLNPDQHSGYFPLVRQEFVFPSNSSALYNVYTHRDYRGRGFYKQVLNGIVNWAFTNNKTVLVTAIETDNTVALNVNQQMGFEKIAKLSYRCVLGHRYLSQELL